MRKSILILLCIVVLTSSAQASLFDDIYQKIAPHQPLTPTIKPPITPLSNDFKAFMDKMLKLNTPLAIHNLNTEMSDYNVTVVKVQVTKTPWKTDGSFYIIRNLGVSEKCFGCTPDMTVTLTHSQVMRMYHYFKDGQLDILDRWQIYAIYKMG